MSENDLDGRYSLMSVYCEFCTDGFYFFVSVTVSSKLKTGDFVKKKKAGDEDES